MNKDKLNSVERKKLNELKKLAEDNYQRGVFLDRERARLMRKIVPLHVKEMNEAKKEREDKKREIALKIKSLKEERRQVNEDFLNKVRWIKQERKKVIASDKDLSRNLVERKKAWSEQRGLWRNYHFYYVKLYKKYGDFSTEGVGVQK